MPLPLLFRLTLQLLSPEINGSQTLMYIRITEKEFLGDAAVLYLLVVVTPLHAF